MSSRLTLLADLSVPAQGGQLFAFVSARDGVPVTAIVRVPGVPKSTVTNLLQRLEAPGPTPRGDNPDDARSWLVLAFQFAIGAFVLDRNLGGVTNEESLRRPRPAGNTMNWIVGHVVPGQHESRRTPDASSSIGSWIVDVAAERRIPAVDQGFAEGFCRRRGIDDMGA